MAFAVNVSNRIGNAFNYFRRIQYVHCCLQDNFFDIVFTHSFFRTSRAFLFLCRTFIVIVDFSIVGSSAFSVHIFTANTAKEFSFQKKNSIPAVRAKFVLGKYCLNCLKQLRCNYLRKCVCILFAVMEVIADISGVSQYFVDRIGQERFASMRQPSIM